MPSGETNDRWHGFLHAFVVVCRVARRAASICVVECFLSEPRSTRPPGTISTTYLWAQDNLSNLAIGQSEAAQFLPKFRSLPAMQFVPF